MKHFFAIIALFACSMSALAESRQPSVLLLSPKLINAKGSEWIGDSLEQSLQADLHHTFISDSATTVEDNPAAISRTARDASATFVIRPHVQIVADQIRLTAIVFDSNGISVGTTKATGDVRHLFDAEDALADQIRDVLSKAIAKHMTTKPIPLIASVGPLRVAPSRGLPIGTVPVTYSSQAMRDGRDRYLYQVPYYGCFGGCGYGGLGYGFGGFGCGLGGFSGVGCSTFGGTSLAW